MKAGELDARISQARKLHLPKRLVALMLNTGDLHDVVAELEASIGASLGRSIRTGDVVYRGYSLRPTALLDRGSVIAMMACDCKNALECMGCLGTHERAEPLPRLP